jgi:hypothetical protein
MRVAAQWVRTVAVVVVAPILACTAGGAPIPASSNTMFVCNHNDMSDWECPDSTFSISAANVQSVTVSVTSKTGQTRTYVFGSNVDAIFLKQYATENFLARYYNATRQEAKAAAVRAYVRAHFP